MEQTNLDRIKPMEKVLLSKRCSIHSIYLFVIFILLLALSASLLRTQKYINTKQPNSPILNTNRDLNTADTQSQDQDTEQQNTEVNERTYHNFISAHPSISGLFVALLVEVGNSGVCYISVVDQGGVNFYSRVENLINDLECEQGMVGLYSYQFKGWTTDDEIVIVSENDKVNYYNVLNGEVSEYVFDLSTFDENAIYNANFEKSGLILAPMKSDDESSSGGRYSLVRISDNTVIQNYHFTDNNPFVFYDSVNKGFVIIERIYLDNKVQTNFYYARANTYELERVLSNDPIVFQGRGCGPMRLIPREGELRILTGGCLTLDGEKFTNNGEVTIKI